MSDITKEGTIIAIDEIIKFDSGFTKREFVIKTTAKAITNRERQ